MACRESDRCIVPLKLDEASSRTKPGNAGAGKASKLSREQVVPPTAPSGESLVLSRLERITNRAEQQPEEAFNNLFTLLNVELLRMAFDRLKRNKAPGIDGRTVKDYEANLESNLQDLEQLGVHALLRTQSRGKVQAETENVEEENASEGSGHEGLAAKSTDGPDRGSLADPEREATRSLSVLWDQ